LDEFVYFIHDVLGQIGEDDEFIELMKPSHLFQNSLRPDFDQGDALLVIQACALDFLEKSVLDAEDILAGVDELEEEPNRLNDEAVLPI
tara:strand:+ start:91 stop:357 length:267 start_codon:yes stop_codon:yes gene_type:complete